MTRITNGLFRQMFFGLTLGVLCAFAATQACAQGELEKTPWATSLIYPVGDPLDYARPAPGEINGFSLARGLNLGRRGDRHEGLDLGNRGRGAQVRAVAPGLVVCTRTGFGGGWGNMVVLAHRLPGGDVLFSLFAHLMPGSISVHEGQVVALGQPLGKVGQTGHASGPHLHLEFRSIKGSLDRLSVPFGIAWEKATVVDPLRMFTAMLPPDANFSLASAFSDPGTGAGSSDVVRTMVELGGLGRTALAGPEDALSRGELYRLALSALESPGAPIPSRWSGVKSGIARRTKGLPEAARAPFDAARMPARETDARRPAGFAETIAVFAALDVARAGVARVAEAPSRAEMETQFPHGLIGLETSGSSVVASPPAARFIGPPAVTRRQACLLWAYVESGANATPANAAARGIPSTETQ
jgi:murein DD-endopeptidase MepM/ murein hydrolase activator NlpD